MIDSYYYFLWASVVIVFCIAVPCKAQKAGSIEALRKAAMAEVNKQEETSTQSSAFTSGALGLQKLNPEISVSGDFLWKSQSSGNSGTESEFMFRGLGLHLDSYLDPFTRFKAALEFHEDETELGEAFMTRFGILPNVNLTLGKFRQQFGVVNRWHKHGLDQVDFPLALRMIFGEGGLNQVGASVDWSIPSIAGLSHELTLQATDGENARVFGGNTANAMAGLARYHIFRDISDSLYAELGVSGLFGKNNEWQVQETICENSLATSVHGIDFTMVWEPTDRMRYRNLTWRTEAYSLSKDILANDGSGEDNIKAKGAYSYLESKVSRSVILGIRGDYFEPDTKQYAEYTLLDESVISLAPLAVTDVDSYRWQIGPYITWHQSPFVYFRAEYNKLDGKGTGAEEDVFWLQCIFAAGPHKHERY